MPRTNFPTSWLSDQSEPSDAARTSRSQRVLRDGSKDVRPQRFIRAAAGKLNIDDVLEVH